MADNALQRAADAEQNRKTYQAVMRFSAELGVPFCLGLGMFFTQLVMANGIGVAAVSGILVHVATFIVVKLFFSH
jgi:hypothetical protein